MKILNGQLRLAATDVSNHLACRHLTQLELAVARGIAPAPEWAAPDLKVIQELGKRHEAAYLDHLEQAKGLKVVRLPEHGGEDALVRETLRSMAEGAEAIAQGALGDGRWFGRPDVLLRVERPSQKWRWSYEVQDTKLARETKAGTILQLSVYSELLGLAQGGNPESMWVVTPNAGFTSERYRVAEYAAYFRYEKRSARAPAWQRIRNRSSTATCAGGSRSAMRGDARTIIYRWWRVCGRNSASNCRTGM